MKATLQETLNKYIDCNVLIHDRKNMPHIKKGEIWLKQLEQKFLDYEKHTVVENNRTTYYDCYIIL